MNLVTNIEYNFMDIDPVYLSDYLKQKGWKEQRKIKNLASVLSINIAEKQYSLLLPTTTEIPDYESRIIDVLRVLEKVEKRSQSELIKVFINVQSLAQKKQCEILSLRFKFKYKPEQTYFSAKKMGQVLSNLQNLFEATAKHHEGKQRISKEIQELSQIFVFETFQGSFGIKVNFPSESQAKEQLSLFPLSQRISETFLNLIKFSNIPDKENLRSLLKELNRKSAFEYRKFLMSLKNTEADFYTNWGSVNPNGGGSAKLDYQQIINTVDFINKMEEEAPEENTITGKIIGFNTKRKTLEFEDILDSNKDYIIGFKNEELTDLKSKKNNLELTEGKLYRVIFTEITSINPSTGEEKTERTLLDLDYYKQEN